MNSAVRVTIPLRQVIRSGPPSIDTRGMLFQLDGGVYRAFRGQTADMYRRLLGAAWLPDLFAAGLVEFHEADVALEGYDLVVEARRIPNVSYPPEWPTAMLREAGATIARVGSVLAEHRMGLQDAHPWNVVFDGTRAVFIDLGSVIETDEIGRSWVLEFRRHVASPLALHGIGLHGVGDAVMAAQRGGWTAFMDRRMLRWFPVGYIGVARHSRDPRHFFAALSTYMRATSGRATRTAWSNYYQAWEAEVGDRKGYTDKQASVDSILGRIPSGTVLDIGSNAGWYSRLAVSHGHTVTALDTDDAALGALYHSARREELPILPLRMDVMWPTGSSGFGLEYRAAPERLRSDTVLALAVIHHLVGKQNVTLDAFARVMDLFTTRYLALEWIPPDDSLIARWPLSAKQGYDLESLLVALSPYFELRATLPSSPKPRSILLFERQLPLDGDPKPAPIGGISGGR